MASGCIVTYKGKRGTVYRMKYVDASGRQVMDTIPGARNKTEAKEALQNKLAEVNGGYRRADNKAPTFGTYKEEWYERESELRAWRDLSRRAKRGALRRLASYFDHLRLDKIHARDVKVFRTEALKHYDARTVGYDMNVLADVLKGAVEDEILEVNVAAGIRKPKVVDKEWRILRPEEILPVLQAFTNKQAQTMFRTLVETGLRKFELCNLRWKDVHLADPTGPSYLEVRVSKSKAGIRKVALSPALSEALWQWRRETTFQGEDEYVFSYPNTGSSLYGHHAWYSKHFQEACRKAGIEDAKRIRPYHDMRHTAITSLVAYAPNLAILGAFAGHADARTTQHYVHLAGSTFPDMAAALSARYGLAVESEEG
jgi:integrase